jgi:uncharacterized membrane protein YadS
VYYVSRKYFKFSREWSAPLASGISICGVSAAIATGGAIRARPIVPIIVSSLVVVFTCIEMLILPFAAQWWLSGEPMVAGAWMGLAVKSDGGAIASGAIADALIRAKVFADTGIQYQEGWITMAATTVKIFIDVFIGIWSFILAMVWCSKIECRGGQGLHDLGAFPKFVIGYFLTFILMLLASIRQGVEAGKTATGQMDLPHVLHLDLHHRGHLELPQTLGRGFGKLAAVCFICLFGFIIWVGLGISWIFFSGMEPPIISGIADGL